MIDVDQDTFIKAETAANDDNDELQFFTQNSERMRILSGGNVGINTTAPTELLHVLGNIRVGNTILSTEVVNTGTPYRYWRFTAVKASQGLSSRINEFQIM